MSITTEIRRTIDEARTAVGDPKPLHALAGAGDLVVERVRTAAAAQQKTLRSMRFEPSAVSALMSSTVDNVRGAITGFPDRAQDVVVDSVVRATSTYDELAERGAGLVRRITRQRASQDLADQVENTVRSAKAASTTARNASATTVSRVKATATSASNAATAAGAATTAAMAKTGSKRVAASTTRTSTATGRKSTPRKASPTAKKATKRTSTTARTAAKSTAKKAAKQTSAAARSTRTAAKKSSPRA